MSSPANALLCDELVKPLAAKIASSRCKGSGEAHFSEDGAASGQPGVSRRQQAKAAKKLEKKAAKVEKVVQTGRVGPSGQALRGAEQKSSVIEAPPQEFDNPLKTPSIEAENVHKVYDTIADSWHGTRYKMWPRVEEFIRGLPPRSLVADLGCGNGKNVKAIKEGGGFAVPSDISRPLVEITASEQGVRGLVADCLSTPLRAGIFDAAVSIAVLHHLSTEPRRVQALREAARLLRPGGRFLVYCWGLEQNAEVSRSRHRFGGQDVLVPFHYKTSDPDATEPDASVEGQAKGLKDAMCERYCHVYREGELETLLAQVPELDVKEVYFDAGNWCAISERRA